MPSLQSKLAGRGSWLDGGLQSTYDTFSLQNRGVSESGLELSGFRIERTDAGEGFRIGEDGPQFQGASDTVPGGITSTFTLAIGGSVQGRVNTAGDDDWYAVNLVAGQSYVFTLVGSGGTPLDDPYLELRHGTALVAINDDSGPGYSSTLRWTATTSGTYFVNARGWEPEPGGQGTAATGQYTLSAAIGAPQDPLDTIDYNYTVPVTTIEVYFATGGQTIFGETALRSWTSGEIAAAMSALATYSAVSPLTFVQTTNQAAADFTLMLHNMEAGVLGYFSPTQGFGAFSPSTSSWTAPGALAPGSSAYATLVHEFGHALGLAHPHDEGGVRNGAGDGSSEIMQGVIDPFGSYGTFQLNQGVFTTMSYNDGWATSPFGSPTGSNGLTYGQQATPMALDIALIQQRYGVNPDYNDDATVYTLTNTNGAYRAIWDTGGEDSIVYSGTTAVTIDLRAATLLNAVGGGGYVSFVSGVHAGFTIANGVVIENATGGGGSDTLTGNSANNRLSGGNGADVLRGNEGNDYLEGGGGNDQLHGGDGDDVIVYDSADTPSNVNGNDGHDILVFLTGTAPTSYNLTARGFEAAEGRFTDTGNSQAWATHTLYYDVQWRLDREVLDNDDGSETVLDYDQLAAESWSLKWTHFDNLARVDLEVLTYDDGSRANLDYDQASANAWSTLWSLYDAADNLLAEANDYDDGTRITLAHDATSSFDWTENWVSYDALDRVDAEAIDYDNGSRITRDHDQNDAFDWATDWVNYDALDRVDVQVITYDDGTYAVQDFDQNDDFDWASQWWLYDADDNLIAFQGVNDDGSIFG